MRCCWLTFHQLPLQGLSLPFCAAAQYLTRALIRKLHVYLKPPESSPNAFQPLCSHSDLPLGFAWNSDILMPRIGMPQGKSDQRRKLTSPKFFAPLSSFLSCLQRITASIWDFQLASGSEISSCLSAPASLQDLCLLEAEAAFYFSTSVWQLKNVHFLRLGVYVSIDL